MKIDRFLPLVIIGFSLVSRIAAETPAKPAPLPDSSTVVFENDKVRAILYQTGKNVCGFGMHSHPAHLYIQLQPAKFRVNTPDGCITMTEIPNGKPQMSWSDYQAKLAKGEMAPLPPHP